MTIQLVPDRDTLPIGTDRTLVELHRDHRRAINRSLNIPTFRVHRNGSDQTGIATATHTKIQFTTRGIDSHTYWDATNYRYLPKVQGKYFVSLSFRWNYTPGSDHLLAARVLKNATVISERTEIAVNGVISPNVVTSAIVELNGSTDYIEFYAYQASGSSRDLLGTDYITFAEGYKVSD